MDENIGPRLPSDKDKNSDNESAVSIGPVMPQHLMPKNQDSNDIDDSALIGPALPPQRKEKNAEAGSSENEHEIDIGPKLPSCLQKTTVDNDDDDAGTFGPALPPGFKKPEADQGRILGPQLPPGFAAQTFDADNDDDQVIGPLPSTLDSTRDEKYNIAAEFENRSKRMKDKLEGKDTKKVEREEWMTELPPVMQGFGVGPRQFRKQPTEIGDRSGWTDTPADKLRKATERKELVKEENTVTPAMKRDAEIAKQLENYKEDNRGESLLSMHEKTRKRKLEEDEESGKANIRRPFDRDLDLQANRFDEAAKKRMLKQSAGLSSRFSHGETSGSFL